jgi:AraC-like DNA-binding protein
MNKIEKLAVELLQNDQCQINVRKAGTFRFPASYRFEAHSHVEYEINYISSGTCVMTFKEGYVPLKEGECIIVSPYEWHGFLVDVKSGCKLKQAEMSIQIPNDMKEDFPFCSHEQAYYVIRDCEDLVSLIEQVAKFHRIEWGDRYMDALLRFSVIQLVIALGYHTSKVGNKNPIVSNPTMIGIMKYIQENYCENLVMEDIAGKFGISSRYLRKYFSTVIGMSCIDYITLLRINKAKELLWESHKSITEIALAVGYGTVQYFNRVFKSKVGMSPTEYRETWKEKDQVII